MVLGLVITKIFLLHLQKYQTSPGISGLGASKNTCSWLLVVFAWGWLCRKPPHWCCQFGDWRGVVGARSWWGRLARVQHLEHWNRWNIFRPHLLIPWHFPWFCKWCWWLHCLVVSLSFHSNSGVHWIGFGHAWQRGTRYLHEFAISCHLPCSGWWP